MRIAVALRAAVERASDSIDAGTKAVAARAYAEACLYTGRQRKTREAYELASRHAREAKDGRLLGQILVGRVGALTLMGEVQGTGRLVAEARRLLERAGDLTYLAKLYMNLGSAHYHAERFREAVADYERATRYFQAAGDVGGTWVALRLNQGIASTQLFRLDEAQRLFVETEERAHDLGLERLEAQAQFNRASLEALRGDYREALAHLERAEATFERQETLDMQAASRLALSEIYLDLAMPREALDLARTAAVAFEESGMTLDARLADLATARSLLLAGQPDEALPVLERCLQFFADRRIRPRRAEVQLTLGRAHRILGRYGESLRVAQRALRSFRDLGLEQGEARVRCQIAEAWLAKGKPGQADEAIVPTLARVDHLRAGIRFDVWLIAGRISRRLGRREECSRRLRQAIRCLEDERRLVPGFELRSHLFDHQVKAYHELIGLLLESKSPRVATLFPWIEAARGRGFRERRRGGEVRMPKALVEQRTVLGSLSRRLESLEFGDASAKDEGERARLERNILSLEKSIARKVRQWEAGQSEGRMPTAARLDRLVRRLGAQEALVEYFVVEERILAIVIRGTGAQLRVLPSSAGEARDAVESLRFQIDLLAATASSPVGTDAFHLRSAKADLETLYDHLVAPIADLLPERGRLTIVPHRFLHVVPFECLHDGTSYIDERWVVARTPTADSLVARRAPRRKVGNALIAGMIEGGPPSVGEEVDSVGACFAKDKRQVLRNPTADELIDAMREVDVVHISSHGFFREDNPIFSRLSLQGGALFLADILDLRLKANLVVLSSCNSGQVFLGDGDDLSGVAHGFLTAGARQLVASVWRVHDEATADWMRSFYRSLTGESNGDVALAMNRAGRAVRDRWPHPFYWGGFCLHET